MAACIFLAIVGAGSSAFAQQLDDNVEHLLTRLNADPQNYEKKPIPPSSIDPVNLDVHWRLFKRVIAGKKAGAEEVEALARDAISLGHRNSPAYATAVYSITASKMAGGELTVKQADKFYELAQLLAPDLPYPTLAYSAHLLRHDLGRFPAVVALYTRGVEQAMSWLDTRIGWALKLMALALLAYLGAALFFLLAQLLRNFGIVAYDCSRVLPTGFSSNQTVIIVVALIVVPGLLLRSPLLSVLIMLGVLSLVQNINERIVTLLIFGLLIALPSLDQTMSAQLTWPGSEAQRVYHAQYIDCDADCESNLEQHWLDTGGTDPALTYTSALIKYRHGSPEHLESVVKLLDEIKDWPSSMRPSVENLRGAALLAQADPDAAIAHFEQARKTEDKPTHAAASFNLMRAYQMKDQRNDASAALETAISTDLDTVRTHLSLQRRDVNSFLLAEPLPAEVFWQRHRTQATETVSIITPVWRALAGPSLKLDDAFLLGGLGILLALLGLPLALSRRTSSPCPKCGMARDPKDAPKTGNHRYCLPCYHTFVSGASLEYAARVHNERVLGRRERFQDMLRRVLSVLMPGTGHSQAGHGLFGFVVIFLTLFGLGLLWRPMGIWRPAAELLTKNWAAQESFAWVLISIGLCVGLSAAVRGIRPTQVGDTAKPRRDSHG